ncbi:MAG: MaoC family dehydratase N-terminal domain-containing protein [Pseudomonadota bacterium]
MSAFTDQELKDWQSTIGRTQTQRVVLDEEVARRYAVAVGLAADEASALGHWAWFMDVVTDQEIGEDGHPKRGAFLPKITLPRRMFASSKIEFHQALKLNQEAEFKAEITDVFHKSGSQGDLVFVVVQRDIRQGDALCNRETQTIVYREMGAPVEGPEHRQIDTNAGDEIWRPSTVNLFRFSAVTFNSHRIHYDQTYTREEEGYPDLVVHGPLTATKLADFAARFGQLSRFDFRGTAPLFQGQEIILRRESETEFHAIRCDGVVALKAKVAYR